MGRKVWTTGDLAEVARLAGTMPAREVRRRLRLSKRQLAYAVTCLRRMGADVTTRYWEPRLSPCPACGRMSATLGRDGVCEPCRLAAQLAEIERRTAELVRGLPPDERGLYERTEALRGSAARPMPRPTAAEGMGAYERARVEEEHAAAMERWAADGLRRRVKAAQKRKDRIRRKAEGTEDRS